jgi:thiamine-phosphate pyrophosphorylase
MTDERLGDRLFAAVGRLPEGAGIVFRHYSLGEDERRALFGQVKAHRPDALLLLAGPAEQAQQWGADGSHGRGPGRGLRTAPAHDLAEIRAAETAGAALVFLSPVFATRSHADVPPLGREGFATLAAATRLPVIALGGMNEARYARLGCGYGWAGIDAWAA